MILKKTISIASVLALTALVAGCSASLNDEVGLVGVESIPALTDQTDAASIGDATHVLDRETWPHTTVQVAVRQTETHPTYFDTHRLERDTAFPTAASAMEVANDESTARKEAALNLVAFPYDLVRTPIQMIGGRLPRDVERSPQQHDWYETLPSAQAEYFDRWRVREQNSDTE